MAVDAAQADLRRGKSQRDFGMRTPDIRDEQSVCVPQRDIKKLL
jgi:hypothetical protein